MNFDDAKSVNFNSINYCDSVHGEKKHFSYYFVPQLMFVSTGLSSVCNLQRRL